jgi:hypothetical protein
MPANVPLRSDAAILIYLLASELVAKPVLSVSNQASPGLVEDLSRDAATVAREASSDSEATEVSAHGIVDGLSRSWDQLATARWRVWDRRGR